MNDRDRERKTQFQQSRRGGRRKDGPLRAEGRISESVQELLNRHFDFDKKSRPDDTRAIRQVEYVVDIGQGDIPALHARWQEEGWLDRLNKAESEALHRAGFRTIRNRELNCEDMYWRRRDVRHLWIGMLAIKDSHEDEEFSACWVYSEVNKSSQLTKQKRWETLSRVDYPVLPFFEDYEVSHETMVRESLVEAWMKIKDDVPGFMQDRDFWEVMKMLCDEGAERFNMLYNQRGERPFRLQAVEVHDWTQHVHSGQHRDIIDKSPS